MFNWLNSFWSWLQSLFWQQEMELTLVGLQNAGKTTLVNCLTYGKAEEDTIPTVGFNMRKVSKGNVQIKLWDIGGIVSGKSFRTFKLTVTLYFIFFFFFLKYRTTEVQGHVGKILSWS